MKKALDQTLRDIKRGVNKNVLKVPCIEQKVLDATSNEPWGPHGSLLADIAEATRRYPHEYQIIMSVLWKRINDTGKNWRHVYKVLTVMEYLVANGSEHVIDEIKEHAYQISTLSGFQYIDSSGKDQGNNVRKKSQSLVILVNDRERIQEVRQKATAKREKYRNASMEGMYKSGSLSSSGGYGDRYDNDQYRGQYGNRDDDRHSNGRERDYHDRDDDRYGRYENSYGHEGDRYTEDFEERLGRGRYQNDGYQGRDQSIEGYQCGAGSRSADRERDHAYEFYSQFSRGSRAKTNDHGSTVAMRLERKFSEQNLPPPPDLEELAACSPTYSERDGECSRASAPKTSSCPSGASPSHVTAVPSPNSGSLPAPTSARAGTQGINSIGHLSNSYSSNSSAYASANQHTMTPDANASNLSLELALVASSATTPVDDPFGDGPFKALPSTDSVAAQQITTKFSEILNAPKTIPQKPTIEFVSTPTNTQFVQKEPSIFDLDIDILADILPLSSSSSLTSQGSTSQFAGFPTQPGKPPIETNYALQSAESASQFSSLSQSIGLTFPIQAIQTTHTGFHSQSRQPTSSVRFPSQMGSLAMQPNPSNPNFYGASQSISTVLHAAHMVPLSSSGPVVQHNFQSQSGPAVTVASEPGPQAPQHSSMAAASVWSSGTDCTVQPSKDKFETKSTVWADTLGRGLVNLNISGSKINPLANIGVDFDAINRKERRMKKPPTTTVTSTVTMGKAMGSGSGIGHTGASALRPPPNPMTGPGSGMAMGGYGVSQQMGNGMGMGMGQGLHVQQQNGYPPGSTIRVAYNPLMGTDNYGRQPYGGEYR